MDENEEFQFRLRLERERGGSAAAMPSMDPTEGMSTYDKVAAGAGKALTDFGRGAGQMVGMVSRKEVDEAKKLDAPLMKTGAGKAGAIGGALVPLSALALVPGANTIAGSAALGAVTGALEPVGTGESRTLNTAVGGAAGGAGAGVLKLLGTGASKLFSKSATEAAGAASRNSVRDATLKAAQSEGYVVPGSAVEGGSANKLLESIGGKAATGQEAAIRNQEITNKIARREAGLGENDAISEGALEAARARIAQPYREVAALSPRAQQALEKLKETRADATSYWKHYNMSADPKSLKEARRLDDLGEAYEKLINSEAKRLGRPELLPQLRDARVSLAKNYDIERALNVGNGNVDAKAIGRMLDKRGEDAMSGGLLTIGKFANAFSPYAREASHIPTPGVSKLAPYGSIALGSLGVGASEYATGTPYGGIAAALPLLSGPARSIALSKMMQPHPSYGPSSALKLSDLVANNPRLRAMLPLSGASLTLEAQEQ